MACSRWKAHVSHARDGKDRKGLPRVFRAMFRTDSLAPGSLLPPGRVNPLVLLIGPRYAGMRRSVELC